MSYPHCGYPDIPYDPAPGRSNPHNTYIFPRIAIFTVVDGSTYYDYVKCTNPEGVTVNVAKAWILRSSVLAAYPSGTPLTIDSTEVTFANPSGNQITASSTGETDETWKMTLGYAVGEEIIGLKMDTEVDDDDGHPIEWIDLNVAGRSWAVDYS